MNKRFTFKYETHMHTSESSACGKNTAAEMMCAYKEQGYDGVFVTDHFLGGNTAIDPNLPWKDWVDAYMKGYEHAKAEGDKIGLKVFFGWESGFHGTEFLIYGLDKNWLYAHPEIAHVTPEEQYAMVHADGGMVVHAHPFRNHSYIPEIRLFPEHVDAVEAINATHSNSNFYPLKNRSPLWDEQAIEYAVYHRLPLTAGSDTHSIAPCGGGILCNTPIESERDYINLLLQDRPYLLTDGESMYAKNGDKLWR